ncbi:MFS transporter [Phytomonospora endophytica]|uniref:EmrB/QacA subfamily drug resistance transporter n=1 Tax=Phytomonospora endophytica TaxID=714109 RepID=A0A841FEN2_9ACTN|nr:MFS transporter [Phytomonospora endophytica]MBB6034726.1 EmrB/QacA subfamily drug resistance transporter [Phytomonospora endophytica]GIG69071.1 MFS transporter [Phytomonospora endophytica]
MTLTDARLRPTIDTPAPAPSRKWSAKLWAILIVAGLAMFLDALDVSMVGVALPSIGAELGMETESLQWIVNGYILGYGGLLLLGGRASDLLGRRKVFLIALAVFGVASLVGGLVDSGGLLIASRIVKGLAAAFTAPAALSIITTTFKEGHDRNRALSLFTIFGATGYASGLIVSGLLTGIDWRLTFFAPVIAVAIVIVAAFIVVPKTKNEERGQIDFAGAATLTGGMLAAVYTIVTVPETGFTPFLITTTVAAVVLLAAFLLIQKKVREPLVRLGIFKVASIVRANLAALAIFGSYISFQTIVSLYLQNTLKWEPLDMALALAPAGIIVAFLSPVAGKLIDRFGTRPMIIASMASFVLGYAWFIVRGGDAEPAYFVDYLPSFLLLGLGFALGFSAVMVQATEGISDDEQGLASGLVQTSGQIGGAVVLAVVTGLISGGVATSLTQYRPGLYFVIAVAVVGLLAAASALLGSRKTEAELAA